MAKMYALDQYTTDGDKHSELKGKGIPSRVLKLRKTYEDYYNMLESPHMDYVEFQRIGCKRQRLEHYRQCKKGLGCYNDKVFQRTPWQASPLGHWRNADQAEEPEHASPPVLQQ